MAAMATLRISMSFTEINYTGGGGIWLPMRVRSPTVREGVSNRALLQIRILPSLTVGLPTPHSHLSDSIGSSFAAFHAGHNPKMIPTPAEIPIPTPMAHGGT